MAPDGTRVTTNPEEWDSDGDGLSDGEEIGELVTGDFGFEHYAIISDPNQADTDGDGLLDSEEIDMGTSPYDEDTDGDTLSDTLEVNNDFDPLHSNPDGDHRRDDEEYAQDSDPFYFNPTALIAGRMVMTGLLLGDFDENLIESGWLAEETYLSLYYVTGWLASGFIGVGDVRDTIASLVRLDAVDTAFNALAFVPLLGDGSKVVQTLEKIRTFALNQGKGYKVLLPLIRWVMRTFEGKPFLTSLIRAIGFSQETIDALDTDILKRLAKKANRPEVINRMVQQGGEILHFELSATLYDAIKAKADDPNLWNLTTGAGERYSTEATVQILETKGYEVLYVQRTAPLYVDANGVGHVLHNGPDLVARNPATGNTVVVEIKGTEAAGTTNFTSSRFKGELKTPSGTISPFVPSRQWLVTNSNRYLLPLQDASNTLPNNDKLRNAWQGLQDIVLNNGDYEAILMGFSTNKADFGKLDDITQQLTQDALKVHTYLINP